MSHQSQHGSEPKSSHTGPNSAAVGKGRFFLGAVSGAAVAVLAPLFNKQLRPVVRGAIKGGIASGRYVRKVAEGVAEDFQDITAEARAELNKEQDANRPGGGSNAA